MNKTKLNNLPSTEKRDLLEMFLSGDAKSEKVEKKILAISFLEAYQRYYNGEWLPNFSEVEDILGIPRATLHSWWKNREQILRLNSTVLDTLPGIVATKLAIETLRLVESLASKGYDGMQDRDKINLLNTFTTKMRLLSGKSTSNIAVKTDYNPVEPGAKPDGSVQKLSKPGNNNNGKQD